MGFLTFQHPLWLAGFRPFFTLALVSGMLLPLIWALVFSGSLLLPGSLNLMQWHAHEMLFGFGGALLFGFLLTASKNWVKVRGIHGVTLFGLVFLWCLERFFVHSVWIESLWVRHIALSLFVLCAGLYILKDLLLHRKNDSFKDNYFFYVLLVFMLVSKNLLISQEYYTQGAALTVGLFRLAFAVMFERTMTQFMKGTENVFFVRNPYLDTGIKFFVLVSAFGVFLPQDISPWVYLGSGVLLVFRWLLWKPHLGFKKFSNATMYLGYLGLVLHFLAEGLRGLGFYMGSGAFTLHIFTFLCMGFVGASMMTRIAQGHTGRKPQFNLFHKTALSLLLLATFLRLIMTLLIPENYLLWIQAAGVFWALGFLILLIRLTPFLWSSRIDGKEH